MMELLKNFFRWLFEPSGLAKAIRDDLEEYAEEKRGNKNYKLIKNFKHDKP